MGDGDGHDDDRGQVGRNHMIVRRASLLADQEKKCIER